MLAALERIHTREPQLIHADIKPANVLRSGDDWKLADFDIAKPLATGAASATNDGANTPAFMAPGQNDPNHRLTPADDVYSLGATLHYALTGTVLQPRQGREPQLAQDVPDEWGPFISEACRLLPQARATIDRLRQLVPHDGRLSESPALLTVTTASTPGRQARTEDRAAPKRRRRWPIALGTAVAAALLAGGIVAASRGGSDPSSSRTTETSLIDESVGATNDPSAQGSTSPGSSTSALSVTSSVTSPATIAPPSTSRTTTPQTTTARATTPATTAALSLSPQAHDTVLYRSLTDPINCAYYDYLKNNEQHYEWSTDPTYWSAASGATAAFNTKNWQAFVDSKPLLSAWIAAIDRWISNWDPSDWQYVIPQTLNTRLGQMRSALKAILDSQTPDEANIAAQLSPDGNGYGWGGILGSVWDASYVLRSQDLMLDTYRAIMGPNFVEVCSDYWLV